MPDAWTTEGPALVEKTGAATTAASAAVTAAARAHTTATGILRPLVSMPMPPQRPATLTVCVGPGVGACATRRPFGCRACTLAGAAWAGHDGPVPTELLRPDQAPADRQRPVPVVLDCDPGTDDAFALMWAVADPEVDLLAVTTVAGNQDVATCTRNARRVLSFAGAGGVPVVPGAARPLVRPAPAGSAVHGPGGLAGFADALAGVAGGPTGDADAVTDGFVGERLDEPMGPALAGVLTARVAPVTVVATGPLTNLAHLVAERPDLLDRVAQVVWMGGTGRCLASSGDQGSARVGDAPATETNAAADPEALEAVLSSTLPLTVCGLDVTRNAAVTPQVVEAFDRLGTSTGAVCAGALRYLRRSYRRVRGTEAHLHDPVALARAIDPSLVPCEPASVNVDTSTGPRPGTLRAAAEVGSGPRVLVATALDTERFWARLVAAVAMLD